MFQQEHTKRAKFCNIGFQLNTHCFYYLAFFRRWGIEIPKSWVGGDQFSKKSSGQNVSEERK